MNTDDPDYTPAQEKRWKKSAKYVCGVLVGVVVVGAAVAVTLAATRSEAQRENLIAYLRGQADGLKQGGGSTGGPQPKSGMRSTAWRNWLRRSPKSRGYDGVGAVTPSLAWRSPPGSRVG